MLAHLHLRGEIAIAGRRGRQRLWDLAERWYPPSEARSPTRRRTGALDEQRFRALGVRLEKGRLLAHPDATDGPIPDRATLLSPFDRLIHDRDRTEALWDFFYRLEMYVTPAKREYGYYVLPLLVGDRIVGRAEPVVDRRSGTMRLLGAWGDTSRLDEALSAAGGVPRRRAAEQQASGDDQHLLGEGRDDLAAVLGDDDEILDPAATDARQVETGLDRDDVADGKCVRRLGPKIRCLVNVEPDAMSEPVAVRVSEAGRRDRDA